MEWSAAGAPLIAMRAIHFAATAVVAGALLFRMVVAKPVLGSEKGFANPFRRQTLRVLWLALACAVVSGTIWLLASCSFNISNHPCKLETGVPNWCAVSFAIDAHNWFCALL